MVEQATKCDAINYERDNLTPGPTPKAKKDDLAKKLTACKNAYLQQGTRLARMKAEMKGQR